MSLFKKFGVLLLTSLSLGALLAGCAPKEEEKPAPPAAAPVAPAVAPVQETTGMSKPPK